MYSKLGLATKITSISKMMYFDKDDKNFERLGAARLSAYADFGMSDQLDALIVEFQNHYKDTVHDNKNSIVDAFTNRDFEVINPLMEKIERIKNSGF